MTKSEGTGQALASEEGRRTKPLLGFLAVLVVIGAAHGPTTEWFQWKVTTSLNPAFLEAFAWRQGRLSLPYRLWDTAEVAGTGAVFNVFPPLQSVIGLLAAVVLPGGPGPATHGEMKILPLMLFGLPLPIVGYLVFFRRVGGAFWGAVLTIGWLGGTAVLPCIHEARNDGVHHINHLLSQVGLLLLAGELVGRRRLWGWAERPQSPNLTGESVGRCRWPVALLGLLIAVWSRQLTAFYAVALLVVAWGGGPVVGRASSRARRMAIVVAALIAIASLPLGLNWAKFGSPFRSGYELIYTGRTHELAQRAQTHGLFSADFIGRNAYYMNVASPWKRSAGTGIQWQPSEYGASLWLTTPLLVLVLACAPIWWRGVPARALMLCTVPIIVMLLLYHGTGQRQFGYYRFALDFIPVWLVVGGPGLVRGRLKYVTLACVAWSVAYFALLARWAAAQ